MEVHGIINSNEESIGVHTTIFSYRRNASERRTNNILQYNSNMHLNHVLDYIVPLFSSLEFSVEANRNFESMSI